MKDADEREYVAYVTARIGWMRKVAFVLCGDSDRADDIVQTALTRLYVHWRKAAEADNIEGYVRTMIVRVFLGDRRSAWSRRVTLFDDVSEDFLSDISRQDSLARGDPDTRVLMSSALARVPPRQRAVLVLRYYCDMSVEETAAVMHCSDGTVKSQTSRGLDALRRALGGSQAVLEGHDGRLRAQTT